MATAGVSAIGRRSRIMPYRTNQELPDSVKDNLPSHAQDIYREAFDNAWDEYPDPDKRRGNESREEVAHKVAWAAVKQKYEKVGHNGSQELESTRSKQEAQCRAVGRDPEPRLRHPSQEFEERRRLARDRDAAVPEMACGRLALQARIAALDIRGLGPRAGEQPIDEAAGEARCREDRHIRACQRPSAGRRSPARREAE